MHGLWKISSMGEETGIQSATGTILHFLFLPFFSPVSLGLDSGRPNTQKRRLGTEFGEKPSSSSSRSKKLGSQCSERGNASVFSRSASIRRATVTVVAMGLAAQKLEGGVLSLWSEEPWSWDGQANCYFSSSSSHHSPGCRGNCTKRVAE